METNDPGKKENHSDDGRKWLAGDHHVHSKYSCGYDTSTNPPAFNNRGDGVYETMRNVEQARKFGLKWMVTTDHGGPKHSRINLEHAYPDLQEARKAFPDMLVFYGMEFDTPAADHTTMIIPHSDKEAQMLHDIESRYSKLDPWPADPGWDTEERMIEALKYMASLDNPPLMFSNHPARTAPEKGVWGLSTPRKFRQWNDTAPNVMTGFEGSSGHQAYSIIPNSANNPYAVRGAYHGVPTMGGYDQMTAIVGGVWDSMLGEGRRWWITAASDSHFHIGDGGIDFWPGEYSKTYVKAHENYDDIFNQLRSGRIFVTTGDLINELDVTVEHIPSASTASIADTMQLNPGSDVTITIRFRESKINANGDRPEVKRVDLIVGEITGRTSDLDTVTNPTTKVVQRFAAKDWNRQGEYTTITYTLKNIQKNSYIRIRGTDSDKLEPEYDPKDVNPWDELWFYSNPVFVSVE